MECTLQAGDRVTLKKRVWHWIDPNTGKRPAVAPQFGEVYRVRGTGIENDDIYVLLSEFPGGSWLASMFRRVIDTSQQVGELQRQVREIFETGKTPDLAPIGAVR